MTDQNSTEQFFKSTVLGHPSGLFVLFFTEMWERFGFYLIIGIFFLYMTAGGDAKFPGMGFSGAKASDIYGSYLA